MLCGSSDQKTCDGVWDRGRLVVLKVKKTFTVLGVLAGVLATLWFGYVAMFLWWASEAPRNADSPRIVRQGNIACSLSAVFAVATLGMLVWLARRSLRAKRTG